MPRDHEAALSLSRITAFGCIDELGSVSTGRGLARGQGKKGQLLIGGHHILQITLGDCRLTVQVGHCSLSLGACVMPPGASYTATIRHRRDTEVMRRRRVSWLVNTRRHTTKVDRG